MRELTALELQRIAPPSECEEFTGTSWTTIKKLYPEFIREISERRKGIRVRDLLKIGEKKVAKTA
jgi:hypothetical protein